MAENMMCSAHKVSTPEFRDGWERVFCCKKVYGELTEDERRLMINAMHCIECGVRDDNA